MAAHSRLPIFALSGGLLLSFSGLADAANCPARHVGEIESHLGCVETIVTASVAPTGPSMADGGRMQFREDIAQGRGLENEQIHYLYVPPGDRPVANRGDRVRVCLLNVPKKTRDCDPAKDVRGREFVVLNQTRGGDSDNAAIYTNGEHFCGGA